jgi:hypothetical protein
MRKQAWSIQVLAMVLSRMLCLPVNEGSQGRVWIGSWNDAEQYGLDFGRPEYGRGIFFCENEVSGVYKSFDLLTAG